MSPVLEICVVVVTLAIVALAWMATRLMLRLDAMTHTLENGFHQVELVLEEVRQTSKRVNAVIDSADGTVHAVHRGVAKLERVVTRVAAISSVALDEFEVPVLQATALWRGVRAGVSTLKRQWTRSRASTNGARQGERYE